MMELNNIWISNKSLININEGANNVTYDGSNDGHISCNINTVSNTGDCARFNDDTNLNNNDFNGNSDNHNADDINAPILISEVHDPLCACKPCIRMMTRIKTATATNPVLIWCDKKYSEHEQLRIVICKVIGLKITVVDFCSDIYTAKQHYDNCNYVWFGATIACVALPIIITDILSINWINLWKREIRAGSRNLSTAPLWIRFLLKHRDCVQPKFLIAVATPILPFYIFTCDLIEDIRKYRNPQQEDSPLALRSRKQNAGLVKLREVMGESFTQATLQQYIVFQVLYPDMYDNDREVCFYGNENGNDHVTVETWQKVTISLSLIALSFGISTSVPELGRADDACISSRIIWFIFGMLAVASRIYVACMYSMIYKQFLFLPLSTELAASILIWSFVSYFNIRQLNYYPHHSCTLRHNVAVALTWIVTSSFNSFTWSGLIISSINLMWAFGAWFLPVPTEVARTALILSVLSWAANVLILISPCFKRVRDDWFRKNKIENRCYFY